MIYHPDPQIDREVAADAAEGARVDLAAGMTPELTEPDREKFERLKSQAELKAQWADAMLRGEAFPRQYQGISVDVWYDVDGWLDRWDDALTYRRKPAPTLEERNDTVKAELDGMKRERAGIYSKDGKRFYCEFRFTEPEEKWARLSAYPCWNTGRCEYRIVELPSPRIEPFTFETCPLGAHVLWKNYKQRGTVQGASERQVQVADCQYSYSEAMRLLWLIPDPSKPDERRPFGRVVSE